MQLKPERDSTSLSSQSSWWSCLAAAAASALGVPAQAQVPADQGEVGIRQLHYVDHQPGHRRVTVRGWAVDTVIPISERWLLEAYGVVDSISGASPTYYTAPSSLKNLSDRRRAFDLRVTHQLTRDRLTLGAARSREADYQSSAHSLIYSRTSLDQNSTWSFGASRTADRIDPVTRVVNGERKIVREWLLGWTQVLTPRDLVQVQWTQAWGEGYFSDPYKVFDKRPESRRQGALLGRWNHHLPEHDATARMAARAYRDSFDLSSAMISLEWSQRLGDWTLTPMIRGYAQTGAFFFSPPDPLRPDTPRLPADFEFGKSLISMDQRMAAFGARTLGLRIERRLQERHSIIFKMEHYEQRTRWGWLGGGGAALRDFRSNSIQLGYTYRWDR